MIPVVRCSWGEHEEMREYHDTEWGVPEHDEAKLFEFLTLEGAQAGLSWLTILRRRDGYRTAFAGFDPEPVARFGPKDVERLLSETSIIRNRSKIESTVTNAAAIIEMRTKRESFGSLLWSFVGGTSLQHNWKRDHSLQASSTESKAMSTELKRRGFRFVGPTTCYSLMQAAGLVNDHQATCFRYDEVRSMDGSGRGPSSTLQR